MSDRGIAPRLLRGHFKVLGLLNSPQSTPCSMGSRHPLFLRRTIGIWSLVALTLSLSTLAAESTSESDTLSDTEIERILLNGKILQISDIGVGVTRPQKLQIELDGVTLKASFKSVNERIALARFSDGETEMNFTDSYLYERAAYLLDRHLQLNMVPVAVLRKVRRFKGAVVAWIDGAVTETERRKQKLSPPDPNRLKFQRDVMYIFHALIANTDPNAGNQLTTPADWKLHLIDHSRSFRRNRDLSREFLAKKITLPRSFYEGMKQLTSAELKPLFKKLLGPSTINALLIRRDKIIEKIERDRAALGDAAIFQDTLPSLP
jgi:hypothetical protein